MSTTTTPVAAYVAALEALDADAATAVYVAASSGDKARIRVAHQEAVTRAMLAATGPDDIARVQAMIAYEAFRSEAVGTTKAPADPREGIAVTVAALVTKALDSFADLSDDDATYVADLVGLGTGVDVFRLFAEVADGPGIGGDVRTVAARIKTPAGRGASAPGGDIAAHIYEALTQVPAGTTLTVAQIRAASTEAYPQGAPSGGAISARLYPVDADGKPKACTVDGVTPALVDGKKGARLA